MSAPASGKWRVAPGNEALEAAVAKITDHENSGIDVPFPEDTVFPPGVVTQVDLGVQVVYRPAGSERAGAFLLVPRSSISKTPLMMANSVGLVDASYRGNLRVAVRNLGAEEFSVKAGDSLFQVAAPSLETVSAGQVSIQSERLEPSDTARGEGGFGSTGR